MGPQPPHASPLFLPGRAAVLFSLPWPRRTPRKPSAPGGVLQNTDGARAAEITGVHMGPLPEGRPRDPEASAAPADHGATVRSRLQVLVHQASGQCQAQGLFVAVEKGQAGGLSQQR